MERVEGSSLAVCPSERELLKLVRGELASDRLDDILAHTGLCEGCALVVAESGLAIALEEGDVLDQVRSSAPGLFVPGQLIASRYRIQARIGRGGMGEVYSALDEELGERIALKIIASQLSSDPLFVERFKRELRLARKVSHPNVCKTLEFGRHEIEAGSSQCFFTMQFIDGVSLRRRLIQGEPFELREALTIVADLALGLHAIHEQNIVHRDIKPDNVVLARSPDTRAWVPSWLDFGVARIDLRESTSRGMLAGTPDYTAPELLAGKVATRASDIYALGLVLHEVLVGDLPFAHVGSFSEAAGRPSQGHALPSLRRADIPAALAELVQECLEACPEHRPATARLLADRVRTIRESLEPAPVRRQRSRRWWPLIPAAGVVAALAAYVGARSAADVPAAAVSAQPNAVSSAAVAAVASTPAFNVEAASLPSTAPPAISLPAPAPRAKTKRTEVSPKPTSAPSAPPHTVSDFGGRR
jgi:hypothetical protein